MIQELDFLPDSRIGWFLGQIRTLFPGPDILTIKDQCHSAKYRNQKRVENKKE